MSNFCPLTGLPCPHPKCIHVTDLGPNYTFEKEHHFCMLCGPGFIENENKPKQPPVLPTFNNFLDLLMTVVKQKMPPGKFVVQNMPPTPIPPPMKPPCPACGWTLMDIASQSRLGCPTCYEHYKNELMPVILAAHKATQHLGKKPKHQEQKITLQELEHKMNEAVKAERYEEAAELKKLIAELKSHDH